MAGMGGEAAAAAHPAINSRGLHFWHEHSTWSIRLAVCACSELNFHNLNETKDTDEHTSERGKREKTQIQTHTQCN